MKSDAIDTVQKQIKFISDHFNFGDIWSFISFYELMKIQVLPYTFWICNDFSFSWDSFQKNKMSNSVNTVQTNEIKNFSKQFIILLQFNWILQQAHLPHFRVYSSSPKHQKLIHHN